MNSKTMKVIISAVFILFISGVLFGAVYEFTTANDQVKDIMLITKNGESNFWKTVFKGAQAAANEYNINLHIRYPDSEDDYNTQNQMIQSAIDNKYDAIVFSACDFDHSVEIAEKAISSGIPITIIDSPINSKKKMTMIGTDNVLAGQESGEAMAKLMNYKGKIGIVNFEKGSANGMQREQGFCEAIANYPDLEVVDIRYSLSNIEDSVASTKDILKQHPDITGIIALNEWVTLGMARALQQLDLHNGGIAVIGFDNNIESVEMLENGIIDGLIVQNAFAMGYLGVEEAIRYNKNVQGERFIDTGTTFITVENMYNIENQKLLFPFTD